MLNTPCSVISNVGRHGYIEGPLSGIVGLFSSVVNMDLNWLFKMFAFSVGSVKVWSFWGFNNVPMPLLSCFRVLR